MGDTSSAPVDTAPAGRTVLVTGCSSGIGRAAALEFHRGGWDVVASARRPASIADLADAGIATVALDVCDARSMTQAVAEIEAGRRTIGVLVNNAGYGLQAPVEELAMEAVREQFETNVFGLLRMCQLVLPGMRRQGWGRIINVSSMGGRFTFPGGGAYHASKHAVEALSDALRLETFPFGVRVSVVEPGVVQTEFGVTAVSTLDESGAGGTHGSASGPYDAFRIGLAQRLASSYDGRRANLASSPQAVARVVVKATSARHPRPRYVVGPVARVLITTRRVLPDRAFDALMRSQYPTP